MASKIKTTTRSYTLGLLAPSDTDDWLPLWHRLFMTHHAICQGAREFGQFYLNLRGGLTAELANHSEEEDEPKRRLLQRGSRRMLSLGWLSVEDNRGSVDHPHRIKEIDAGKSLPIELAESLLRDILRFYKGVVKENELCAWVDDCILALTANIRPDAVIVNRAAAFAEWQKSERRDAAEMPDQARRIVFGMCGNGFVSLNLPDEASVKEEGAELGDKDATDSDGASETKTNAETEEAVEPSNASRGIFGDLFGGDAAEKLLREAGKDEFATAVGRFLFDLGDRPPTRESIAAFRIEKNLPELDRSDPEKYPKEVSSSGAPTSVAKRYRKLLVSVGLWPKSNGESGVPRTQAISSFAKRGTNTEENERIAQINAWDLIDVCPARADDNGGNSKSESGSQRVFTPSWANDLAERVANATNIPVKAKSLNEFKRLMFALAARRISQTQSWTKINEIERHRAAVKEDATKESLDELDADGRARIWLLAYEYKRAEHSEAQSGFRITNRMIGECDAVFAAWKNKTSSEERDKHTASIQSEAEKFGDPMLYIDLSADPDAEVIWSHTKGAELLKQWVKFRQAQHDQQRFKIPRFCHPDPFHHPTWGEFGGSSKPKVWYAWSNAVKPRNSEPGGNADGSRQLLLLLPDFEAKKAGNVPMRWRSKRLSKDLGGVRNAVEISVPRADRIGLAAAKLPTRDQNGELIRYRPKHPFTEDAKGWNARLQLSRDSLLKLEKEWDSERGIWLDDGDALRFARWFITFAPALAMSEGPGRAIHPKLGWKTYPHSELNQKQKRELHAQLILSRIPKLRVLSVDLGHRFAAACAVWETLTIAQMKDACGRETRADELFIHVDQLTDKLIEKGRKKGQKIIQTKIYRRIGEDFLRNPKNGEPTSEEHPAPWARLDRQFLIKLPGEDKPARAASKDEWAMVVKLAEDLGQTEDEHRVKNRAVDQLMSRAVRIATLGLKRHARRAKIAYALDPATQTIPGVGGSEKPFTTGDDEHINFLTNALFDWHGLASESKWHDLAARALWNQHIAMLDGASPIDDPKPTDPNVEEPTRQQQRKKDDELREKLKSTAKHLASANREIMHREWRDRWNAHDGDKAVVPQVPADQKGPARTNIIKDATGWHARLRILTDWIMGRRLQGIDQSHGWKQNVGGLSLDRIATMKSLYQLHKAFAMRAKPDKPRGAPEKGESNAGVAQSILNAMEQMREQRVKQLASRIAGSALGLGGHWKQVDTRRKNSDGTPKIKWVWMEERDAKYSACHAVVIENLTNYRPEEMQTRRENRQLMEWSSAKVKKYLSEACQLHGLHLREVQPGYTSKQDSRTGAPGIRCVDVPINPKTGAVDVYWWANAVSRAEKKIAEKSTDAEFKLLTDIADHLTKLKEAGQLLPRDVRVLRRGGDLFVAAPSWAPLHNQDKINLTALAKKSTQADLNAAANIGLKALMDPDWAGKWWYIPALLNSEGYRVPAPKSCAGVAWERNWKVGQGQHGYTPHGTSLQLTNTEGVNQAEEKLKQAKTAFEQATKLLKTAQKAKNESAVESAMILMEQSKVARENAKKELSVARKGASAKEIINLWRDPASVFAFHDTWTDQVGYWKQVKYRVINNVLRVRAGLESDDKNG